MRYMGWSWDELQATPMSIYDQVVEEISKDAQRQRSDALRRKNRR